MTLLEAVEAALSRKEGTITHMEEIHKEDCISRDGCQCSCEPDYKVVPIQ